jgi:hypothetical protein
MKNILFVILLTSIFYNANAQVQGCNTTRYITDVTPTIKKTTVTFGSATNQLGLKEDLAMNIYTPENDNVTKRPVILFVHGGSFIFGARTDMDSLCASFARKGYVTATPDYRLFPIALGFPDSVQIVRASIEALHDTKAAIRYFTKDAATTNTYKIDTKSIIIGGISAGSIIALHIGMLDSTDIIPSKFKSTIQTLGGFDGNSGNPGYPSDVVGVINMSGALFDVSFIDKNDPPFTSIHGTADVVVPIGYGSRSGNVALLYGSDEIVNKANTIGIPNQYVRIIGGGHTDIYTDTKFGTQLLDFLTKTTIFSKKIICKEPLTDVKCICKADQEIRLFPNPTEDHFAFIFKEDNLIYDAEILDLNGRILKKINGIQGNENQTFDLGVGIYTVRLLKLNTNEVSSVHQLVVQKQ